MNFKDDFNLYGIDWSGPVPSQDWGNIGSESEQVVVPEVNLPFDEETVTQVVQQLQAINPLEESGNFGIDLYEQALSLVSSLTE